ncbi:hypothetical protein, partial [Klebsiella pneumoniae]|uniref:hypothetical protein n=1 Tax=Klebsiella pneumoniae TaxID=573 RepID=UPI003EE1F972
VPSDVATNVNSGHQAALIIVANSVNASAPMLNAIYAMDDNAALTVKNCAITYASAHSEAVGNDALTNCITIIYPS